MRPETRRRVVAANRFAVYVVENAVDGKRYFGKATDVAMRWKQHQRAAERGKIDNALYRAMRKYGFDSFTCRTVCECATEAEAYRMEAFYIEQFDSLAPRGYNLTAGGVGRNGSDGWPLDAATTIPMMRRFAAGWEASTGRKISKREWDANTVWLPSSTLCVKKFGVSWHEAVHGSAAHTTLTVEQILAWAEDHRLRTGRLPSKRSGLILADPAEDWRGVDEALRLGHRGLPGGSSLSALLGKKKSPLTVAQIVAWAEAHLARTGALPTIDSGAVFDAPGETWTGIDQALRGGWRGLPGGSCLAQLLGKAKAPPLTIAQILEWAEDHRQRTGSLPTCESGPVLAAPSENWSNINRVLRDGGRGLPGGSSLPDILGRLPCHLTVELVRQWADAHRRRTGAWPSKRSGAIPESPGDTWRAIDDALRGGWRGLAGGSSLAKLLGKPHPEPLTDARVWELVLEHQRMTGQFPTARSGQVVGLVDTTWVAIDLALRQGLRGLPGGSSLFQLIRSMLAAA